MKNQQYVLADGTPIMLNKRRGAPRNGGRNWIHSYVSFVDGTGASREITSAELHRCVKAGWIRIETFDPHVVALRQMNATTGFFTSRG